MRTPTTEEQLVDGYADARCTDPHGNHEGGCTAALKAERLIQQIKEAAWEEGVSASGIDLDYILQLLDNNPYRSQQ